MSSAATINGAAFAARKDSARALFAGARNSTTSSPLGTNRTKPDFQN